MRIDTILDAVEERLKADELFSNINIIKAYPCSAARADSHVKLWRWDWTR